MPIMRVGTMASPGNGRHCLVGPVLWGKADDMGLEWLYLDRLI